MANLPTLKVLLDNSTGTFPFDITSKVLATDGYSISRGRDDWQSAVTAGELGLALNNSDGRFTPGSTILATPSPIVVDQRIRVQEVVNGTTFTRFTGYVKSWPVEWPETVATFAKVRLSAVDAQARAERRILRSPLDEEILTDSPTVYYTLTEDANSVVAGDSSGNQVAPLTIAGTGTAPTFGTGLGPDGPQTAVSFTGGQFLTAAPGAGIGSTSASILVEVAFVGTVNPASGVLLAGVRNSNGNNGVGITLNTDGTVVATCGSGGTNVSTTFPSVVTNGVVNYIAARATISGGNVTVDLFIQQAKIPGTPTALAAFASDMDRFSVGSAIGATGSANPAVTAAVSHFAVTCSAAPVSDARILAHGTAKQAGVLGTWSESGSARMTRLAGYAGVPVGSLDTSLTTIADGAESGGTAWTGIQEAADAELGVAYVDGAGSLVFHNRNRAIAKTAPDLTLPSQWVTPDVAPVNDDQQLVNYMEVTAQGTGGISLARNTTSITSHGQYSGSRTYLVLTDAEALDRANWLVGNLAEPVTRYGTLTLNLYAMTPALAATVLTALDIDCWLRITLAPSQNPGGTTADVIVQGWQETTSADTWTIQCNVVAASLFSAWILDDTTFSVLGTTTRLYV